MWTFKGSDDLVNSIRMMKQRAEEKSKDVSSLKREQAHYRTRAAAFAEVLELLKDYFAARPDQSQGGAK